MDMLKPPTDNLYKFVAISGIVLVGFFIWLQHGASIGLLEHGFKFEADHDSAMLEAGALMTEFGIWFEVLERNLTDEVGKKVLADIEELAEPAKEQKADAVVGWFSENEILEMISASNAMGNLFDRGAVLDYWTGVENAVKDADWAAKIKKLNSMNDLEFASWIESVDLQKSYQEFTRSCKAMSAKMRLLSSQGYRVLSLYDELEVAEYFRNAMLWLGGFLAVAGFALWYHKVQRYQDAILEQQASDVLKADARH